MYQCSQKLERPREYIGAQAVHIFEQLKAENRKIAHSNKYRNKLTDNEISYSEFNLKRN
jgi:hypothetical protein